MRLLTLICLCALSLPSCTLPPSKVTSANVPLPSRFDSTQPPVPEIATSLKSLFPSSDVALWINRALTRNPDLKASLARLQEAGFNTRRTRAALSPTLFENAAAGRSDFGSSASNFSATLDAQWELDVWGQIRAGVTAASRDEAALAADYAAARQSIAAQTAQAYFGLVAASQLVELNERSLKSFESTFSRVERRFERGLSSLGDSELARTDVENTRAQLAARQNQRDQAARRLATLTGDYPKTDRHAPKFPSLSKSIPSGVPSTLLMKRTASAPSSSPLSPPSSASLPSC